MDSTTYSDELETRLARGVVCLDEDFRSTQGHWLLARRNPDGGFSGRAGESDLYYTGFAVRSAVLLGLEAPDLWSGLWEFVYRKGPRLGEPADALSLLVIKKALDSHGHKACCPTSEQRLLDQAWTTLDRFRHPDGGYRKTRRGAVSLYQTFLAALSFELGLGPFPCAGQVPGMLTAHRGADGGFSDLPGKPAGTNPTAAALGLISMFKISDLELVRGATVFLGKMQRAQGGFAAAAKAPVPDLMSTFTTMVSLEGLQATGSVKLGPVGRFVRDLAMPGGGFAGAPGDDQPDVEYTYYGLGTLALLAGRVREARWTRNDRKTVR